MVAPEDYEFVEPLIDKGPLQPIFDIEYDNDWERDLHLHSALLPLYLGKSLDSNGSDSFKSKELVEYTATFYDRSRAYHALLQEWTNWNKDSHRTPYTTYRAGVHIFAPLYVQELEGPMRYQVAALNDLLDEFRGSNGDWKDRLYKNDERRYFGDVLNTCIQIFQSFLETTESEELDIGFDYLTKALILIDQHESFAEQNDLGNSFNMSIEDTDFAEAPIASDIRNGFAHANYKLSFNDAFELSERNIDIELDGKELTQPIDSVISYISRQMTLMHALSTGVTLALYHISITEDYDDQISILYNVLPGQIDESDLGFS